MALNKLYKRLPDGSFVELDYYEYPMFGENQHLQTPWFLIILLVLCILGIIILSY